MRILIIHSRPINIESGVGGFPVFLEAITSEYKRMGLDVIVYGGSKSANEVTRVGTLHDTIPVYSGPIVSPSFWVSRKKLKVVANFCKQQGVTVIHAQGVYTPGFMVRRIYKLTGIPYVLTSHSDLHPGNSKRLRRYDVRLRCRNILRDAAAVTHLSPLMAEAAQAFYDVSHKSVIVHNGVKLNECVKAGSVSESDYLLAVGRVEREKGFLVLIEMFAEMLHQGASTSLVIAGTGTAEKECRDLCVSLGLNVVEGDVDLASLPKRSVIFAGFVKGERKQELFARCKFVLFATQPDLFEEPFGIVQLEAMAAAKPLLASDIAIVRYLVSLGLRADVVRANDIHAWSDAGCRLLRDDERRQSMGLVNFALAREFSWSNVAEQYAVVYRACDRYSS